MEFGCYLFFKHNRQQCSAALALNLFKAMSLDLYKYVAEQDFWPTVLKTKHLFYC